MSTTKRYLTYSDLSKFLNVPQKTLEYWVSTNHLGIPYIRLGARTVRFDLESITTWLKSIEQDGGQNAS